MSDNRFKKVMTRRSSKFAAALALLGVALVATTQTIGSASAATRAYAAYGKCTYEVPKACLWIHANDQSPKTPLLLAIVADATGVADLETPTDEGHGIVRRLPEQFTDNVSNGVNRLPYTLCLIDSANLNEFGNDIGVWSSRTIMPVPPGGRFTQLDDYNDIWDTYTTTSNSCPSSVRFRTSDNHIIEKG